MPKDNKHLRGQEELSPEEIEARKDERFRTFFSTSVAQVPEEMNRRMEQQEEATMPTHGLLGKLFRRDKTEPEDKNDPDDAPEEMPTGEISLDGDEDEPQSDLQLAVPAEEWERFNAPEQTDTEGNADDFDMELTQETPCTAPEKSLSRNSRLCLRLSSEKILRWKRKSIRKCRN